MENRKKYQWKSVNVWRYNLIYYVPKGVRRSRCDLQTVHLNAYILLNNDIGYMISRHSYGTWLGLVWSGYYREKEAEKKRGKKEDI